MKDGAKTVTISKNDDLVISKVDKFAEVEEYLINIGGLTRFTLTSDRHHRLKPNLAKEMFGLGQNWEETKLCIAIFFGIDANNDENLHHKLCSKKRKLDDVQFNEFEKLIISLM